MNTCDKEQGEIYGVRKILKQPKNITLGVVNHEKGTLKKPEGKKRTWEYTG